MTEQTEQFKCPHCPNTYPTEYQLKSHVAANHWKISKPNVKGKP